MQSKPVSQSKIGRARRRVTVTLLAVAALISTGYVLRDVAEWIGYLAVYASQHGESVTARSIAHVSRTLGGSSSERIAQSAIDLSFETPLSAALQTNAYQSAMEIVRAWEQYTGGRDALPYYWMGMIFNRMGNTQMATRAYTHGMKAHNRYPTEQRIGFLTLFVAATNLLGQSDCVSAVLSDDAWGTGSERPLK
jgi:hypothetical protein